MNSEDSHPFRIEDLLAIEQACDRFEEELRKSGFADPQNYLETIDEHLRDRLRFELTAIQANIKPTKQDSTWIDNANAIPTHPLRGNRFELHESLGRGGAGEVWRAMDKHLGRWVALKAPRADSITDTNRFLMEARLVAKLQHPRIVRVLDAGQDELGCFMVCELVEGITLSDSIKSTTYSHRDAALIVSQIAEGIGYAHKIGIVHRDLKPQNILLNSNGQPLIADFGLAREWFHSAEHPTLQGQLVGTPAYMAPEQAKGEIDRIEPRTDVYALGVILYQMLTGELPFRGDVESILHQIVVGDPPSPRELNGRVPKELDVLCMLCLEKSPSQRMSSAEFLEKELKRFLDHEPILSRPLGRIGRIKKFIKRSPSLAASLALACSLLLIIATLSLGSLVVVSQGWNREFRLRVDTEIAKHQAEEAQANEREAREQADLAKNFAEVQSKRAKEEATLSDQSLHFMESVLQATDPVGMILGVHPKNTKESPKLIDILDDAAQRIKNELSDQPRVQSKLMDTIANSYRGLGRYSEAIQLLEQSRLIRAAAGLQNQPEVQPEILRHRLCRAIIHQELAEYRIAESQLNDLLTICHKENGVDSLFEADVEFQLGWLRNTQQNRALAKEHFSRALDLRQQLLPSDSLPIKAAQVGILLSQSSNMSEIPLQDLGDLFSGSDRASGIATDYLAMLAFRKSGNLNTACQLYEKILADLEKEISDQHPIYILASGESAELLWRAGRFREALPRIERAIAIAERLAPKHPKLLQARELFANELLRAQRFQDAYQQLHAIVEFESESPSIRSGAHEALVWTSMVLGHIDEGLEHARVLVKQYESAPKYKQAWGQYALARILDQSGDATAAQAADKLSLELIESSEDTPGTSLWHERQSTIYNRAELFSKTEEHMRAALDADIREHQRLHPHVADRMHALARFLHNKGRPQEALPLAQESLSIREATLPTDDVRIPLTRELLTKIEADL